MLSELKLPIGRKRKRLEDSINCVPDTTRSFNSFKLASIFTHRPLKWMLPARYNQIRKLYPMNEIVRDSHSVAKPENLKENKSSNSSQSFRRLSARLVSDVIIFFSPGKKWRSVAQETGPTANHPENESILDIDGRYRSLTSFPPSQESSQQNPRPESPRLIAQNSTNTDSHGKMAFTESSVTILKYPIINENLWSHPAVRKVPRPLYPVRLSHGNGSTMRPEDRRQWLQTGFDWLNHPCDSDWWQEPDLADIVEILREPLGTLGFTATEPVCTALTTGGFNKIYSVVTGEDELILRLALPIDPYFKTENDVANTEFVRHFTNIPVPRIYAFDSSGNNKLGLEWMLMEKVRGVNKPWIQVQEDDRKLLLEQLLKWQEELLQFTCPRIGGLYIRFTQEEMEFYQGPSVDNFFFSGNRPYYGVFRGPFNSLAEFYNAIVDVQIKELLDPAVILLRNPESLSESEAQFCKSIQQHQETIIGRLFHPEELTEEILNSGPYGWWHHLTLPGMIELKESLPRLAEVEVGDVLETNYFLHDDLSNANIMIEGHNIEAILDWESNYFSPLITKRHRYPRILEGRFTDSSYEDIDDDTLLEWAKEYDKEKDPYWEQNLEELIMETLRRVYKRRLREIASPLTWFWEDHQFDDELHEHVLSAHQQGTLLNWIKFHMDYLDAKTDEESSEKSSPAREDGIKCNESQNGCNANIV